METEGLRKPDHEGNPWEDKEKKRTDGYPDNLQQQLHQIRAEDDPVSPGTHAWKKARAKETAQATQAAAKHKKSREQRRQQFLTEQDKKKTA